MPHLPDETGIGNPSPEWHPASRSAPLTRVADGATSGVPGFRCDVRPYGPPVHVPKLNPVVRGERCE